jgi:hypothetical protein
MGSFLDFVIKQLLQTNQLFDLFQTNSARLASF